MQLTRYAPSLLVPLSLILCISCGGESAVEPPPEPAARTEAPAPEEAREKSCLEICRERAGGAYEECMTESDDPKACRQQVGGIVRECMVSDCGEPAVTNTCETDCGLNARKEHASCVDQGGDPQECGAAARRRFADCKAACTEESSSED